MPVAEAPACPERSRKAAAPPTKRDQRKKRARRVLSGLLAGLNRLLELGDFSRGDVFRD